MKRTGASLVVYALEQIGVKFTFGIPGVHNTELYDELNKSELITPILVTHEQCASFMGDAISRTTDSIGCAVIVPAAGMTHAMSGIGESFLDGVPLLVVSGGIRRDTGRHYQLHDVDQICVLDGITKAAFRVTKHEDVLTTIYRAYQIATSGEPGPVFVEIAGDVQMFTADVGEPIRFVRDIQGPTIDRADVDRAVDLILKSKRPGLYLGWGARDATSLATELADLLGAPVSTTLQGLSVFPSNHPLHTGMGFGPSAVPVARKAFETRDCLIAVGVRFAELATGSYGMRIPEDLIHIDINPNVFNKNYKARVTIEGDSSVVLASILETLRSRGLGPRDSTSLKAEIKSNKEEFVFEWTSKPKDQLVSPGILFQQLRRRLDDDSYMIVDDGNHTFLAVEQFPVYQSKHFISPTDFNCMGYCVPASIAVKLSHPDQQVVAVVGDGAFLMTALEIITASVHNLGVVFLVFHDGELAQISQFQQIPLNRKTCTVLGEMKLEGIAIATGAAYLAMQNDGQVRSVLDEALEIASRGRPVIVDVKIDYSRRTEFTRGVVKVNLSRFPLGQKFRFIGRALKRHLIG
jgi:acetolactate synthase-1/2/3 large subunit